ncbi:MAG: type II toxin-antitoxin system HicA family toxin [Eggerthellaceae bacterium]|nr:type II toxin-antitoxin system HicA family toxin [Eggerthellaceae bacterium]
MPKQEPETRDTKKVFARLVEEGWTPRPGKGDHMNLKKPGTPYMITIDMGKKEMAKGMYDKIAKQAGWK